jgi:hypothetical protein
MKWVWVSLGLGAGYVLGTRTGKERLDRFARWSRGAADDIGLSSASEQIMDSAKSAGGDLHDAAAARSQAVLGKAADAIAERIDSVGDAAGSAGD